MKKIYTFALLLFAISLGFSSCTKDDVYRPGGPSIELNADDSATPPADPITDPDDDGDADPTTRGGGNG